MIGCFALSCLNGSVQASSAMHVRQCFNLLGCCRRSGVILLAYVISTVLVICWLIFTIHITLQENREDAAGVAIGGRTSEHIRVHSHGHRDLHYYSIEQLTPSPLYSPCLTCMSYPIAGHAVIFLPQTYSVHFAQLRMLPDIGRLDVRRNSDG